jgi:outer membrane protein
MNLNFTRRYTNGSTVLLGGLFALTVWPLNATASFDVFSTEQYTASGPFARTSDPALCLREKILKPLTLADVVELTLCNNPQTRSTWSNARVQAAQLGSSKASYLPILSGPISVSRYQKSAGITVSYLLYDFGGRAAGVENSRQLLLAANATRDETLQTTFLSAVQAYYALLSARASVQAYQSAEAAASKSLEAVQARYAAGSAMQADRLQAQTALSQALLNRIRAEGDASTAQGILANNMGFDANQPFELAPTPDVPPDPVVEKDIGKLITEARQNRPDLLAAEAQIRAAEANQVVVKAAGLPTFTLNAGATKAEFRNAGVTTSLNDTSVGLSVHVPWFSAYRDTYKNRAAQAQMEGTIAERDRMANQIALDVWSAYQLLLTSSQALRAANDLVASATQFEQMAIGRYKNGVGSILDMLTAQSTLAGAQQQRVAALFNFQTGKFVLARAIGQLDLTLVTVNY